MKRVDAFSRFLRFLASKRFAVILFLSICVSLVPGTLAKSDFGLSGLSRVLFGLMGLNLFLCTLERIRTLSRPVLVLHVGTLITIAGMVISSFGYVATVQIYEGTAVDSAYRWDMGKDEPLGYELGVQGIHTEYYPVPLRVGVLRGEEKAGLFELKTGQSFTLGPYTVVADAFELPAKTLKLSIRQGGSLIASTDVGGSQELPPGFPYRFVLVAYRNPVLERAWTDLRISRHGEAVAAGTSEVNGPFRWNGLSYYCTSFDTDPYGAEYAGIQIVRDPGRPVVFAGFIVILAGCALWVAGKFARRR